MTDSQQCFIMKKLHKSEVRGKHNHNNIFKVIGPPHHPAYEALVMSRIMKAFRTDGKYKPRGSHFLILTHICFCVMYGTHPNGPDWGMFKEKAERNNVYFFSPMF